MLERPLWDHPAVRPYTPPAPTHTPRENSPSPGGEQSGHLSFFPTDQDRGISVSQLEVEAETQQGRPQTVPMCLLCYSRGNGTSRSDTNLALAAQLPTSGKPINQPSQALAQLYVAKVLNPRLLVREGLESVTFLLNASHICAKWENKQMVCGDQDPSMSQQTVQPLSE